MNFFNTFRGRLLVILALLLVATLSVQFYLNLVTQSENNVMNEEQSRALVAGITIGSNGITSNEYMQEILDKPGQTIFDETAKARILDVIIIDNEWQIRDSLNPELLPRMNDDESVTYKRLEELTDLPPLMESGRLGEDLAHFPNQGTRAGASIDDEAHPVPIQTSRGRWYVMVLLRNDRGQAAWRAAQPLMYTLAVLLVSALITIWLVWRFSRPIADISDAARKVADGDLSIRVPKGSRHNELGLLTRNFNEMTAELEKKRELEAQLQQAEKSAVVGRLGSAIAHEIRNPLNYINLTLDHLRAKFAPAEGPQREIFQKLTSQLKGEVARINQQITDFLNYSRPATATIAPMNVRNVVEESLRIVEAQAAECDVKIAVIEHENVRHALGDSEFLRSVFNNLFINAVQAMGSSGGHLTVKIQPAGEFVEIEIADTGPGIKAENLESIFEPYFSTKDTGTGLGLAIVHKIVEAHNGRIDVKSAEGKGATFTIFLPVADGTAARSVDITAD